MAAADGGPKKQEAMQHLIKSLAHNEKKVRDKSLKILQKWLSGKSDISSKDMSKIWQALFFCMMKIPMVFYFILTRIGMWHSDKVAVQQELAQRLSKLIHSLPTTETSLEFIASFWSIMRRDWHMIDRLRLDKYLSLLRIFMNESFQFLKNKRWDVQWVQAFADIFTAADGPFAEKAPLGVALHIADTTIHELCEVDPNIPATALNILLEAFLSALQNTTHSILASRLRENVFGAVLNRHMREPSRCVNLRVKDWARRFFDVASQPTVSGKPRKQLYALHALYTSPPPPVEPRKRKNRDEVIEEEVVEEEGKEENKKVDEQEQEEEVKEANEGEEANDEEEQQQQEVEVVAKTNKKKKNEKKKQDTPKKKTTTKESGENSTPVKKTRLVAPPPIASPVHLSTPQPSKKARTTTTTTTTAATTPQPQLLSSSSTSFSSSSSAAAASPRVSRTPIASSNTTTPPKRILRSATKGKKKEPSPKSVSFSETSNLVKFKVKESPKLIGTKPAAVAPTAAPAPAPATNKRRR